MSTRVRDGLAAGSKPADRLGEGSVRRGVARALYEHRSILGAEISQPEFCAPSLLYPMVRNSSQHDRFGRKPRPECHRYPRAGSVLPHHPIQDKQDRWGRHVAVLAQYVE